MQFVGTAVVRQRTTPDEAIGMHPPYHFGDGIAIHRKVLGQGVLIQAWFFVEKDQRCLLSGRDTFLREGPCEGLLHFEMSPPQEMR